jgi:hypothetical protein
MADNISLISCPADCATDNVWPAIPVQQDCPSYEQTLSQIYEVVIVPDEAGDIWGGTWDSGYPDPTFELGSIDNTVADNTKAHIFVGIGGMDEPTESILQYPGLQERVEEETYTVRFRILNMSNANNDHLDKLECGALNYKVFFTDLGGFVYGFDGGITPKKVSVERPHGAGNDDRLFAELVIVFDATNMLDRANKPADFGDPA